MPTEVKNRPSDAPKLRTGHDKYTEHDPRLAAHKATQQQQQHREALRLALGSILSPRPPLNSSRSSSGTNTPSYPFSVPSGSHTPSGTPPYYLTHGPNSSDYLHPHHPHIHHPHPHTPSRLGPSKSNSKNNSPSGSSENTAPNSSHPSPLPPISHNLPAPPELELLPPAHIPNGASIPTRPSFPGHPPIPNDHLSPDNAADHAARTGTVTPRSKFMQTLQSKSAWDALIHGSFS